MVVAVVVVVVVVVEVVVEVVVVVVVGTSTIMLKVFCKGGSYYFKGLLIDRIL